MPEPGKTGTFPSRGIPVAAAALRKGNNFCQLACREQARFSGEIPSRPHGVKRNREGRGTADVWTERRKKRAEKEAFTKVRTEISKVRIEKTKVLTVFSKVLSVF